MLDYKDIIIKRYALKLSGREIARQLGVSKSGVNEFLKAFENCDTLQYPPANRDHKLWYRASRLRYGPRECRTQSKY